MAVPALADLRRPQVGAGHGAALAVAVASTRWLRLTGPGAPWGDRLVPRLHRAAILPASVAVAPRSPVLRVPAAAGPASAGGRRVALGGWPAFAGHAGRMVHRQEQDRVPPIRPQGALPTAMIHRMPTALVRDAPGPMPAALVRDASWRPGTPGVPTSRIGAPFVREGRAPGATRERLVLGVAPQLRPVAVGAPWLWQALPAVGAVAIPGRSREPSAGILSLVLPHSVMAGSDQAAGARLMRATGGTVARGHLLPGVGSTLHGSPPWRSAAVPTPLRWHADVSRRHLAGLGWRTLARPGTPVPARQVRAGAAPDLTTTRGQARSAGATAGFMPGAATMPHGDRPVSPTRLLRMAAAMIAPGAIGARPLATHLVAGLARSATGARPLATRAMAEPDRGAAHPASPATGRAPPGQLPLRLTDPSWRAEAGPARMPAPLVHAAPPQAGRGAGPARAGAPAASRSLEAIAAALPRETVDRAARAIRPAAARPAPSPTPELRVIADRVYEVLVDRMRQERRARGL